MDARRTIAPDPAAYADPPLADTSSSVFRRTGTPTLPSADAPRVPPRLPLREGGRVGWGGGIGGISVERATRLFDAPLGGRDDADTDDADDADEEDDCEVLDAVDGLRDDRVDEDLLDGSR